MLDYSDGMSVPGMEYQPNYYAGTTQPVLRHPCRRCGKEVIGIARNCDSCRVKAQHEAKRLWRHKEKKRGKTS
jgi:hypothetical protein